VTSQEVQSGCASQTKSVEIAAGLVAADCRGQEACSAELCEDRMLEGLFLRSNNPVEGRGRLSDVSCSGPLRNQRAKVLLEHWFGENMEECVWNCRHSSALGGLLSALKHVLTRLHCGSLCASGVARPGPRRFWTDA